MKTILAFTLLSLPALASELPGSGHDFSALAYEVTSDALDECNRGYRLAKAARPGSTRDPYAPDETQTPRDMCATILNDDQINYYYQWLRASIEHLTIPENEIRLQELTDPEGQCKIGALIYLKEYFFSTSPGARDLIATTVCYRRTPGF